MTTPTTYFFVHSGGTYDLVDLNWDSWTTKTFNSALSCQKMATFNYKLNKNLRV